MTITDLHCDRCGSYLSGPAGPAPADPSDDPTGRGDPVRFVYHPGRPHLRDTSGLMCAGCWAVTEDWLDGARRPQQCSVCGTRVEREQSLHVHRFNEAQTWRLCRAHAVEFLNRLRTVEPKLDPATFRFP